MKRALYTFIVTTLILFLFSCDIEILTGDENINDYIYPYLEFTISEDESYYTVKVIEGTDFEEVYIPAFADYLDEAVPIKYFDGFQDEDSAKNIKTIVLESSDTVFTDNATKDTDGLVNVKVEEPTESARWGYLPPVEKEEMEFIGWFITGTSTQVFEGDPITNPTIEPRFRDHTLTKHDGKAATCMSFGWEEYVTCSTCSYTTYKEIPKLSHSLTHKSVVEATCTKDGVREYWLCSNCASMFSDADGLSRIDSVSIPALGHKTYHVERIDAECGKEGKKEHWQCERCHSLFSDEKAETPVTDDSLIIAALEHNFVRSQFSAESTCTWNECTLCHETSDPTGHSWNEGTVVVPATETGKGIFRYTCPTCGITMDEDIAPLDVTHVHSWIDKEPVQKTCTKRGYTVRECSECHVSYNYKYDDAEGHKTTLNEAKDANCTEDGNSRYYECSVCSGLFKDRNAINSTTLAEISYGKTKLGHKWSDGYELNTSGHWHTCSRCDAVSETEVHTYDRKAIETVHLKSSASCTESAHYYYSCVCGKNGVETFIEGKALGHSLTHTDGEDASCIREGYYEYWSCLQCGKSYYDESCTDEITETNKNVIPKAAHTDCGTYTSAGKNGHQKYCSVCRQGFGDIIEHSIQDFEWGGSDSDYHWHICRYCSYQANKEKHKYTSYGTDEVCDICRHTKHAEQTMSGGFEITAGTSEPTGTLTVTGKGSRYHAVFILDKDSKKTKIEWYLDSEKQSSTLDECDFTTPQFRTYTIRCVLYNDKIGSSYSQKVYGGGSP